MAEQVIEFPEPLDEQPEFELQPLLSPLLELTTAGAGWGGMWIWRRAMAVATANALPGMAGATALVRNNGNAPGLTAIAAGWTAITIPSPK